MRILLPLLVSNLLEEGGFKVEMITLIPRPTPLPSGMEDWFHTFGDSFFFGMKKGEKDMLIREAVDLLKPSLYSPEVGWVADYVRLRFRAILPDS